MNCPTHVTTQSISFPFVSHRHAQWRPSPLVFRSSCCPSKRQTVAAAAMNDSKHVSNKNVKGMSWFHGMELEVRDYELDQFGVVNNAIYSNYCEYGTYKLFDMIGFEADTKLAVSEYTVKFISPLKRKDKFMLKSRIYDYSTTRFYAEYQIFKLPNHESILWGEATLVLINESLRPSRIPPSMMSKFNRFLLTHTKN